MKGRICQTVTDKGFSSDQVAELSDISEKDIQQLKEFKDNWYSKIKGLESWKDLNVISDVISDETGVN